MVKQESNRGSGRKVSEVGSSEEKEEREREREWKLTTMSLKRLASLGGREAPIVGRRRRSE